MEIRLLGELDVVDDDGAVIAIRGRQLRVLLVALALRCGEVVPADLLIESLWREAAPSRPENALQRHVSTLRRALGEPDAVQWRGSGYVLALDRSAVDVFRFEELATSARSEMSAGRLAEASRLFADALALWRGDALAGLPYEEPLALEATRLAQVRLAVSEARIDTELALGRHAAVLAEVERLVAQHPLHERFRAQLMLALSRSGRQAEAIRAYQTAREAMIDELGIEPSPPLRALEAAILRQEVSTVAEVDGDERRPRSNVRAPLTSLIGRAPERAALERVLRDHRLVTLVGPGGVGKTRLAIESARTWLTDADAEVWVVEMSDVDSGDEVVPAIALALGLARGPATGADTSRLVEFLCGRQVLLVLDDCEHLVARVAEVAVQLLESCTTLTVLVTSREALCVTGEALFSVPPLPLDDAVALFFERARAVTSVFGGDDERTGTSLVRQVCARLDGLPLAIELAAARLRSMPLDELAAALDDRFRLLDRGARTSRPRQQTMRAVVDWSYGLLFDDERRVFDRLSVFVGGCTFEAARAVCADAGLTPDDVTELLTRLADKSLIAIEQPDLGAPARCTMLQTLADYGRERLAATGAAPAGYTAHLDYYKDMAQRSLAAFRGEEQRHWLHTIAADTANLRAALEFAVAGDDAASATAIAGSLGWYWWFTGRVGEGDRWTRRARDCDGGASTPGWARLIGWSAFLRSPGFVLWAEPEELRSTPPDWPDRDCEIRELEDSAVSQLRAEGALDELAMLETAMAVAYSARGDHSSALTALIDARSVLASLDPAPWALAMRPYVDGRLAFTANRHVEAEAAFRASVAPLIAIRGEVHLSFVHRYLGRLEALRGDHASAIRSVETALRLAQSLHLAGFAGALVMDLAEALSAVGEFDRARSLLGHCLEIARDLRSRRGVTESLAALALVEHRAREWDRAMAFASEGLETAGGTAHVEPIAHCLAVSGYLAEEVGDVDTARSHYRDVLALAERDGDARLLALALEGFAGVATHTGHEREAARLFGAADALRRSPGQCSGWAFAVQPRADRPQLLELLRSRLTADVVADEFAIGAKEPEPLLAAVAATRSP